MYHSSMKVCNRLETADISVNYSVIDYRYESSLGSERTSYSKDVRVQEYN